MPIASRMRGGQMLFTQPQIREDIRYGQTGYMNMLYNQRRPSGIKYEDAEAKDVKALQGHAQKFGIEYNNILSEANASANKMSETMMSAGDYDKMDANQKSTFLANKQNLAILEQKKIKLEAAATDLETMQQDWEKQRKEAAKVGTDIATTQVDGRDIFLPVTLPDTDMNNEPYIRKVNNMEDIEMKRQSVDLQWNEKKMDYDITGYDPSGDYNYQGKMNKSTIDLYAAADNQFKSYEKPTKSEIYYYDEATGKPVFKTTDATKLLGYFLKDTEMQNDAVAVEAVKDKIWDYMKADNSVMKDIGVQFSNEIFNDPANLYSGHREATDEDRKAGRTIYQAPIGENGAYVDAVAQDIREEQAVNKILSEGTQAINSIDVNVLENMQKNYVIQNAAGFQDIFKSNKMNISYRSMKLSDTNNGSGSGIEESEYMNMEQMVSSPSIAAWYSKAEGRDAPFNVVAYNSKGIYSPYKIDAHHVPLTGNAVEIVKRDNTYAVNSIFTEKGWGPGVEMESEDWGNLQATAADYKKATGETGFVTKNGFIIDVTKIPGKTLLYERDNEDTWIAGVGRKGNDLYYNNQTPDDKSTMRMMNGSIIVSEEQVADLVIGVEAKPKDIQKSAVINSNDWEIVSTDGNVKYNSLDAFRKDPANKIYSSTDELMGVVARNKTTGQTVKAREFYDWVPGEEEYFTVTEWQNEEKKIDDMSEDELAAYGIKILTQIDGTVLDSYVYQIDGLIPTSIVGAPDSKQTMTKATQELFQATLGAKNMNQQQQQNRSQQQNKVSQYKY